MIENIKQYYFTFDELNFSIESLYRAFSNFTEDSRTLLVETFNEYYHFLKISFKPVAGFRKFEKESFLFSKNILRIADETFNLGPIIYRDIHDVDTIFIFVCTIGDEIENKVLELNSLGKTFEAYILDRIASELVELSADLLEKKIKKDILPEKVFLTNRYSPGYCGWSVEEQKKVFSLLPKNFCGIKLTESAMMIPIKSISGIYGAGYQLVRKDYHCEICDDEFCYRNKVK